MTPSNVILLAENQFVREYVGNKIWQMILLRKP